MEKEDSIKRKQKFVKKAKQGNVTTSSIFEECLHYKIPSSASLSVQKDSSRMNCSHDLNLNELRDFILSLWGEEQGPRYLKAMNKGFIRNLILVHVADCDDESVLSDISTEISADSAPDTVVLSNLRISKNPEELCLLPHKLLSVELAVESKAEKTNVASETSVEHAHHSELHRNLTQYVTTEGFQRLWSYPMRLMERVAGNNADEGTPNDAEAADVCEPHLKMIKLSDDVDFEVNVSGKILTGFKQTVRNHEQTHCTADNIVGLDCEMIETLAGDELARITLVDISGQVLYDAYVLPQSEVKDLRSCYSGITDEHLRQHATECDKNVFGQVLVSFEVLREILLSKYLFSSTVIVGHSLENDLKVMKIVHDKCVDTAGLYPHPCGYPYRNKLKHLARDYLKVSIQDHKEGGEESLSGHCSAEDARAAMQLALLKLEKGESFGLPKKPKGSSDGLAQRKNLIPVIGLAMQQKSVSSLYLCWSEKEKSDYLRHCFPQGSVVEVISSDEAASGRVCTPGYNILNNDGYAAVSQRIAQFLLQCKQCTQPEDIMKSQCFAYSSVPYWDKSVLKSLLRELTSSLSAHTTDESGYKYCNSLVIVTKQSNLAEVIALSNQKNQCLRNSGKGHLGVCMWDRELEAKLKGMLKDSNNSGQCMLIIA